MASVRLLTDREFTLLCALAPHDKPIVIEVWAAFLTGLLRRTVRVEEARPIIDEYNARLAALPTTKVEVVAQNRHPEWLREEIAESVDQRERLRSGRE